MLSSVLLTNHNTINLIQATFIISISQLLLHITESKTLIYLKITNLIITIYKHKIQSSSNYLDKDRICHKNLNIRLMHHKIIKMLQLNILLILFIIHHTNKKSELLQLLLSIMIVIDLSNPYP